MRDITYGWSLGRLAALEEKDALVVRLPGDVQRRPHRPTRVSAGWTIG